MLRRLRVLVLAAGAAALLAAGSGQASAAPAAGEWGRAITVPGLGALNTGRYAIVWSMSCPSAGHCAAGGFYRNHGIQGFVVSQKSGHWRLAIEVPGLGALNQGRQAEVVSVSCASAGNCAAGGYYGNQGPNPYDLTSGRGFVAVEVNGRWRQAIEVPGLGALNTGGNAEVSSVSCTPPGGCAAVGFYTDGGGHRQGFVAVRRSGRWRRAIEVPGLGALNVGGNAGVASVSCVSPGNCAAGGDYTDGGGHELAFVVSETNAVWGTAQEVAGTLSTGPGARARVASVSCGSAGNCAAGGAYSDGSGNQQAFVVSEVNGTWAAAKEVAGSLNSGGSGWVASVSCASAGNCAAGGDYDFGGYNWGFVVSEKNGVWGQAISVRPGTLARNEDISSVSCASPGNCAAGGDYINGPGGDSGFVVSEAKGVWGKAITVPGLNALNTGGIAAVNSVSCPPTGRCVAGGEYALIGRHSPFQGFVT